MLLMLGRCDGAADPIKEAGNFRIGQGPATENNEESSRVHFYCRQYRGAPDRNSNRRYSDFEEEDDEENTYTYTDNNNTSRDS
nr:hypothetical protein CFP56_63972 [Quercus suber]